MRRRVVVVALAGVACGRIGFTQREEIGDAMPNSSPVIPAALVDMSSCQQGPLELAVKSGAQAGDTLFVAFFMREPNPNVEPTIAGAGLTWGKDIAFASALGTNRRTIAMFRADVTAAIAPGTLVTIDHPPAGANGGALFRFSDQATLAGASTVEGVGPGFTGSLSTGGNRTICVLVHHNETSAMFEAPFERSYDFNVNCGDTRNSAGLHIATALTGGTVDCTGTIGANHTWVMAIIGYDNLAF